MPNWCSNRVALVGPKGQIKSFIRQISELTSITQDNHGLSTFKGNWERDPDLPKLLAFLKKNKLHIEGKAWFNLYYDEDGSYIEFDTKWTEANDLEGISASFPLITFQHSYDEPSNGYGGYAIYNKGEQLESEMGSSSEGGISEEEEAYILILATLPKQEALNYTALLSDESQELETENGDTYSVSNLQKALHWNIQGGLIPREDSEERHEAYRELDKVLSYQFKSEWWAVAEGLRKGSPWDRMVAFWDKILSDESLYSKWVQDLNTALEDINND